MPDASTPAASRPSRFPRAALTCAAIAFLSCVACDDDLTLYYPTDAGLRWNYRVSIVSGGEAVDATAVVANLQAAEVLGRASVPQRSELLGQVVVRYLAEDREGIVEYAHQMGGEAPVAKERPDYVLKLPVATGTTWSSTWQSRRGEVQISFPTVKAIADVRETVMVPAGTFADCLHLKITGKAEVSLMGKSATIEVVGDEWYAPDVGFIKGAFRETVNHGEWTSELAMNLEDFRVSH